MKTARMFFAAVFVCFGVWSQAAGETITKPNTFVSGTPAKAAEVNANFDTVYNQVNKIGQILNVDQVNQRIGIGILSPTQKLDVNGTVKAAYFAGDGSLLTGLAIPSGNSLNAADGDPANVVYVDSAGNVGINTGTPTQKLDVNGTVKATSFQGNGSGLTSLPNGYALNAQDGDPANALLVDNNGYVGIGISSPQSRLHVAAQNWDLTTTEGDFKIGNASYRLKMSASTGGAGAGVCRIRSHGGLNELILGAGKSDVMWVKENGIGIGISPSEKLTVTGIVQSTTGGFKFPDSTTQTTAFTGNADTLDGSHASAFATASHAHYALNASDGSPTNSLYIDANGNIGIGITTPTGKMDIRGDEVRIWDGTAGVNETTGAGDLYVEDVLEVDGSVIIGQISPGTYKLSVLGSAQINGNAQINGTMSAISCNCPSDIRLKKNITPLENALDKILSLQGANYEWKTEEFPERNFPEGKQLGFIAQDVEEVIPEAVHTDDDGYKSLSYDKLTVVLVEAIKELKAENESLKKENEEMKEAIRNIREKLDM